MSAVGTRLIEWQGGEHEFCIAKFGDLCALEQSCSAGIGGIYSRLTAGAWHVSDIRETIRLGLIGGGMKADEAMKAVKTFVDGNPRGLAPSIALALAILEAAIIGVPDDPVGKPLAPEAQTEAQVSSTTTAASDAPPSTESAQA